MSTSQTIPYAGTDVAHADQRLPFVDWARGAAYVLMVIAHAAPSGGPGCIAPGLVEALNPREDEEHGSTEEVPR